MGEIGQLMLENCLMDVKLPYYYGFVWFIRKGTIEVKVLRLDTEMLEVQEYGNNLSLCVLKEEPQ